MHICTRLAQGVASWLKFEFNCNRGYLFEEKYLSYSIGQILYAEYGTKVISEYDHPLLSTHKIGPGKRPKMDFAVLQDNNIILSLESKWIGSTIPKVSDIIWDLIRLELMASHFNCHAIFLLAGKKRQIESLFQSEVFNAPRSNGTLRPILKNGLRSSLGLKLDYPPLQRQEIIKELVMKYPNIQMPSKISSGNPYIFPKICNSNDFQVYTWEIKPAIPRKTFLAREHKLYNA